MSKSRGKVCSEKKVLASSASSSSPLGATSIPLDSPMHQSIINIDTDSLINFFESKLELLRSESKTATDAVQHKLDVLSSEWKDQYKKILECVRILQEDNASLQQEVQSLRNTQDELVTLKNEHIEKNATINKLEVKIDEINSTLLAMTENNLRRDQYDRRNNIEIRNLPERNGENLYEIAQSISELLNVKILKNDIEFITRVSPRDSHSNKIKPIIMKVSSDIKNKIITASRKKKSTTTKEINIPGTDQHFFINEHLTIANKVLLNKTKIYAKEKGFRYVWVRNCKIFLRKNDTSPAKLISSVADLGRMT